LPKRSKVGKVDIIMKLIADLHLHSKYSRATSKEMNLEVMSLWSKFKGIDILGTGDFTHPLWFGELEQKLEEQEKGFFKLKSGKENVYFLLTSEISCIYSKGGRLRKIHLVLIAPSLEVVRKINNTLAGRGNLFSDGRPILGMDAKELCKIVLDISSEVIIVPAHVWTPWFSLFGANSGFDSVEECFEEITPNIFAIETGLSSDPQMNWRLFELDKMAIISNSDAHSPSKLGREATVFDIEPNFDSLRAALKNPKEGNEILYTIEFYPEEGKYHYTGHRNCNVIQSPEETIKNGATCPNCGKKLTVGVMHRVQELANRPEDYKDTKRPPFKSLVPFLEIIAESQGVLVGSKKVQSEYLNLVGRFKGEFNILLDEPIENIAKENEKVAEGIKRMREGNINISPGFDGVFGTVKIWQETEQLKRKQSSLF